jgi:hypothetical protein
MKTFGLFMLLFVLINIALSFTIPFLPEAELLIESTLLAYIMQQYFAKEIKNK